MSWNRYTKSKRRPTAASTAARESMLGTPEVTPSRAPQEGTSFADKGQRGGAGSTAGFGTRPAQPTMSNDAHTDVTAPRIHRAFNRIDKPPHVPPIESTHLSQDPWW